MTIFGILTYRNIGKIATLGRLYIDRQITIVIFMQVLLAFISLTPYGIYNTYAVITSNLQKSPDRKVKENIVSNTTYLIGSFAYAGRFYMFMLLSPRFRSIVKKRLTCLQRPRRIVPLKRRFQHNPSFCFSSRGIKKHENN
ncbi:unnamed protein product [Rotaria magnacalcarata]|uniref:Uncharacterized protein n=1 Tax=Rotaria magnacalcarata TaxID=392030 RepID=A0A820HEP9_9BILA|nr:unnamed protein product [Rotaria magnacalcarata]